MRYLIVLIGVGIVRGFILPVCAHAQTLDSAVVIQSKDYYAEICPQFGGNCIRLKHLESGIEVLRTPKAISDLKTNPVLYGMPILFFPNRIRKGRFVFEKRIYDWPINEPERGGYVHGDLFQRTFKVIKRNRNSVTLEYIASDQNLYLSFPHTFVLRLHYWLDENGLHQKVSVKNTSDQDMPFGLSFHTTFNMPFVPHGMINDIKLCLPVGKEFPRDTVTLVPTGQVLKSFPLGKDLRSGNLVPAKHALSNFYTNDGNGCMWLTDSETGWRIHYGGDATHKFWMLWNGGRTDLLVVEPQTCLIDAFNVVLPSAEKGIIIIKPGEFFTNGTILGVDRGVAATEEVINTAPGKVHLPGSR